VTDIYIHTVYSLFFLFVCFSVGSGLERIGLAAEECIAFEDSFSGLASAQAAGLRTVGILTCRTAEEMLARGAFMAVDNFEAGELWNFLLG
jgi:beta-phosphoglucomutase-like phosphatase (HAD superfamily)